MSHHLHHCDDSTALATRLAGDVEARLRAALTTRASASLVVSGGKSPVAFFQCLARAKLDWRHIWITLADERWVDRQSPDSNERTVREHLMQGDAAQANFVSLKTGALSPELALEDRTAVLAAMPRPFDAVVLGMGEDGHTASLFPGAENLGEALNLAAPAAPVAITPPVAPHRRISLNLSAILGARFIALPIQGAAKRAVFERAAQGASAHDLPIAAVLTHAPVPVDVYWAP